MPKYKYETRTVSGYERTMYGKTHWVDSYPRRTLVRVDKKTKESIKKGKAKQLISVKTPLERNKSWDELSLFSQKELLEMAKEYKIDLPFAFTRSDIIERILYKAEKERLKRSFIKMSKKELINFGKYQGYCSIERDCKTKADLIEFLPEHSQESNLQGYKEYRDNLKKFPNDKKFILRLLKEKNYLTESKIKKLVGKEIFYELLEENLITDADDHKGGRYYFLTLNGRNYTQSAFEHFYEDVKIPNYQSMEKEIPAEIMNSAKQLAKNRREYSIGLDFERELKNPQQIVAIQGAESFTYHLYDDFEMFGHTHPARKEPNPSKADLLNMQIGRPEFIVAGKTGKAIILNIEDDALYREWKENPYSPSWLNLMRKEDRERFFGQTGIRIYPYKKGMKVTLIDDPKLEKGFPFFTGESLAKIHESEIERISKQRDNESD